ncbi:BioA adenosylmethionine-8-amini-7-oxononanoate aminotransferase [Hyaloraphidium curvatum]|nr:BioA adenosylmethionine-8-amini-7-oxononanoate aminotransferase [Hyaloraphidium curvatum]
MLRLPRVAPRLAAGLARGVSTTSTPRAAAVATAPAPPAVDTAWSSLPNSSRYPPMSEAEMVRLCKEHTIYTWTAGNAVAPLPVVRAEGAYMYGPNGERTLDFNAQLMSVMIGHGDQRVKDAMKRQIDELIFVYPQTATPVRARLGKLLSETVPGMDAFFFALGGAEANENAIKLARLYTGKHKVMCRLRSYHGGTHLTLSMTGDPRRASAGVETPGLIHVMNPRPYSFSFGSTDTEITRNYLTYIEEVILEEGPGSIAAMINETVTGTNGVLVPPAGLMEGLRALCDKYNIVMICDEVMCGFGRTGKMMAYEHFNIVPDLVTMAKGLTSSYFPLGAVGMTKKIHDFFQTNNYGGGLTYNSHPLGLATAEAVLEVMKEDKLVENAARMEGHLKKHVAEMKRKHPSFKEGRVIGLFCMMDLQKNSRGDPFVPYNGPPSKAMNELGAFFRKEGLFTFLRWSTFSCIPPLNITEEQLAEGFEIVDRGLEITDRAFEG